jgi:hypothetical protein
VGKTTLLRIAAGLMSLVKLSVFAAVLIPASILALSAAVRLGQRRATIIEY